MRTPALAVIFLCGVALAEAGSLNYSSALGNGDFYAYLSTNNAVLGSFLGAGNCCSAASGSAALTPGDTYYLQIEVVNFVVNGNAAGFSGIFSLDPSFQFANGTQSLNTGAANVSYWRAAFGGADAANQPQTWVTPNESALEEIGGPWVPPGIIWANDSTSSTGPNWGQQCTSCYVTLSTEITPTAPEPSTGLLLAPFALGFYGFRHGRSLRTKRRSAN